jgi:hypothetical protein
MINKLLLITALLATITLVYFIDQDLRVLEAEIKEFNNIKSNLSTLISEVNSLREKINETNEKYARMMEAYYIKLWLISRDIKPLNIGNNVNTVTILVFYNDVLYPDHNKTSLEKYFEERDLEGINVTYLQIYSPPNFNILKEILSKTYQTRPYMQYEYVVFLNRNETLVLDLNIIISDSEVYKKCLKYFMLTA